MRLCVACMSVAIVTAALLFGALPALAKPSESQDNFPTELDRFAATLKAQSAWALDAAARAARNGKDALAEAETDATQRLQDFRETLNARKAKLDMIGKDAAARLNAWKQEAVAAIAWFRDWLETHSAPDEPTEIPV